MLSPAPPKILNSKKNREEIRGKCRVNNPGEARAVKKKLATTRKKPFSNSVP
jgi:hypothetical protein